MEKGVGQVLYLSFGDLRPDFRDVGLRETFQVYGRDIAISMVETLLFLPSSLCTSSVPMAMLFSSKSFTKARRNSSTVSTAVLIARPLALTQMFFSPELKKVRQATT